ncbi:hypothetical protein FPV67DRAFT_831010 [Lyophyllum atratum]|nr:hypothetical protein FPV67DRAFT_1132881 [Lyophyllum atratum]KAF8055436.1 hypothetical protein FPV67DRAFT_831010 [Lyophyllum atratum]
MDAYFDNNGNILNSSIRITRDHSTVYTLKTTFGLRGRKVTILRDENPPLGKAACVGFILWKEKAFGIFGQRKTVSEIKRMKWGVFKKYRYWKWSAQSKEFDIWYDGEGSWKVTAIDHQRSISAQFMVPSHPHLFTKPEPPTLHLAKTALEADEVFVILALIYSEAKRQDATNISATNGV